MSYRLFYTQHTKTLTSRNVFHAQEQLYKNTSVKSTKKYCCMLQNNMSGSGNFLDFAQEIMNHLQSGIKED